MISRRLSSLALLTLSGLMLAGCQQIGSEQTVGSSRLTNPSPVTLHIRDDDKEGTANGVGPARYTSVTEGGIQTFQTGSTPRDLYAAILPDGTVKFNLSSGTDIGAKGVKFDPVTRSFEIAEFSTSSSEPLRAGNEAYDRLASVWQSLTAAQREVALEQIKTTGQVASDLVPAILQILAGL